MRGRPRPHGIVLLVGVEKLHGSRDLPFEVGFALPRVEVDPEALERLLDPLEHRGHGIAVERRQVSHVVAPVPVLGRLLPAPDCVDGGVEALHLRTGIVVVVLALDVVPGEVEEPRHGVAVRAVPRRRDGTGPVGLAETIST